MADKHVPYITPIVRNRAAELGVDVATLTGTGVGGRIRTKDVEAAAARSENRAGLFEREQVPPHVSFRVQVSESPHEEEVVEPVHHSADVVIGKDVNTDGDVRLRYEDRPLGVAIIGKAGTGKSSLLEHLILADLEAGTPGIVIDPHGLLAQRVMECATPEQAERIILLEAVRTVPFGLNLLDVREAIDDNDDPVSWAADSVVATIKKLYGEGDEFLPRLERYLDLSARTLIPSRLTLLDAPRLFEDMTFRQECLARVADSQDQRSLRRSWAAYDKLRPGEQITHTEALVNRLERLLAPPIIQGIVGSRQTTVPFDDILYGDRMLLASLPSDRLSPERCDFVCAMLLCALADRIFARNVSGARPPRLHIYLDEYQRFATATTAELLEQGRKYSAGVTLAHQTLYQIPDQHIRNAARHAGTLIALSMTRPDAEELAGEFPITPQEEWIEEIEEIDGTKPRLVPSSTPGEDLYLHKHSDPDADLAARSFFKYPRTIGPTFLETPAGLRYRESKTIPAPPETRKSAGIWPRPGGINVPSEVQMEPSWVNDLLYKAMTDPRAEEPEAFVDALLGVAHRMFLHSPQSTNDEFMRNGIRPWIMKHFEQEDVLRKGEFYVGAVGARFALNVFMGADISLQEQMSTCGLDGIFYSYEPPMSITNPSPPRLDSVSIDFARQRLRWLWILWDGVRRHPVLVPSGEQEPRRTKRHIVHGAQTHADALNEVAGRLVHPPKRYVAHVRHPQEYHQVKLRPPLECGMGDGAPVSTQPDDIRTRSRAQYMIHRDEEPPVQHSSMSPEQRRTPEITRYSQNDEQDSGGRG